MADPYPLFGSLAAMPSWQQTLQTMRVLAGHLSQVPMDRIYQPLQYLLPQTGPWLLDQSQKMGDAIAGGYLWGDPNSKNSAQAVGAMARGILLNGNPWGESPNQFPNPAQQSPNFP